MIHQINFQLQVFFLIWLLAFGQSWDYTLYIQKIKHSFIPYTQVKLIQIWLPLILLVHWFFNNEINSDKIDADIAKWVHNDYGNHLYPKYMTKNPNIALMSELNQFYQELPPLQYLTLTWPVAGAEGEIHYKLIKEKQQPKLKLIFWGDGKHRKW